MSYICVVVSEEKLKVRIALDFFMMNLIKSLLLLLLLRLYVTNSTAALSNIGIIDKLYYLLNCDV